MVSLRSTIAVNCASRRVKAVREVAISTAILSDARSRGSVRGDFIM